MQVAKPKVVVVLGLMGCIPVAGTGMAAQWYGPEAAQGFFHDFSGWAVFAVAFVMMLAIHRAIVWFAPAPKDPAAPVLAEPAEA